MAGRRLKTFDDYNRFLKGKNGLGEGELYKPWLIIKYDTLL